MNDPVIPETWTEIMDTLFADSWDDQLRRYRSDYAFRGVAESGWDLRTSLMQLGEANPELEKHLLRNFKKYAHRDVVERESFWYWLTVAQHHGLPTRLLDWTFSPYVALHFATCRLDRMDQDGAVWCVDIRRVHEALPVFLQNALSVEGSYVFTVEMLSKFENPVESLSLVGVQVPSSTVQATTVSSLQEFDELPGSPLSIFLEPPSIDDRVVNQYALFSVISDPALGMHNWLEHHPEFYKKIIIPSSLKWEVRDKLDQANITERVLFPGLDGLSAWLKRHYSHGPGLV